MTLTATKMRVNPKGIQFPPATFANTVLANFDYAYWGTSGRNGGAPIIPRTITSYYIDNTNHSITPSGFPYRTDITVLVAGANFSTAFGLLASANTIASDVDGLLHLGSSVTNIPSEQFTMNYLSGYSWLTKSFCTSVMYTQASTNTTTMFDLWTVFTDYAQHQYYLVALNGPTQGTQTDIVPPWAYNSLTGPIVSPFTGTKITRFYLPAHPAGAPDIVYYGLVAIHAGMFNVDFPNFADHSQRWLVKALRVDKDTLKPYAAF